MNALYSLGLARENEQKWSEAAQNFQDFISQFPDAPLAPEAHLKLANALFQQNDFAGARIHYQWVLDNISGSELSVEAQYRMADSWFKEGAYEKALVMYLRIPIVYPPQDFPELKLWAYNAELQVAECYKALNEPQEAAATYDKIVANAGYEVSWKEEAERRAQELR